MKKKNLIIMKKKRKKKFCAEKSGMGYCPFVLQEKKNCIAGSKAKLYCKRKPLHCIVAGLTVFILQYTVLYCRKKKISVLQWVLYCKRAAGRIVSQYSSLIVTEARHGLYCNTVTVPTTQGAGLGVCRRGSAAGAGVGVGACAGRADGQALGAGGRSESERGAARQGARGAQAAGRQGAAGSSWARGLAMLRP